MLGALAACDRVFGLDPTRPLDAVELADTDGDGVPDVADNCMMTPNPTQSDKDGDGKGDACDDCPLVADPAQHDLDHDGIGDACDPDPEVATDCLLLFDSFHDPTVFAAHWQPLAQPGETPSEVVPNVDSVSVQSTSKASVGFVSRELSGQPFAVELRATTKSVEMAQIAAASNVSTDLTLGYFCMIDVAPATIYANHLGSYAETAMSGLHIDPELLLRLQFSALASTNPQLQCRADFGDAIGLASTLLTTLPMADAPGMFVSNGALDVTGIAIYAQATTCPTPIIR